MTSAGTSPGPADARARVAGLAGVGRTLVMGIVNVTPDSFSDGGRWLAPEVAVAHGRRLRDEGADILDIGGESTRPGSEAVPVDVEIDRVRPVAAALVAEGAVVSVDTLHAETAEACLRVGAAFVNDVSGGLVDPEILAVTARNEAGYILGHLRGEPATMNDHAVYADVVGEVRSELSARVQAALAAGVDPDLLVLDPGLGFAKAGVHNWELLAGLDALMALGHPVLVGASRKRFLGSLLAGDDGTPPDPPARDRATAAVTALVAAAGAWGVRVHDVRGSVDAVRVAAALSRARSRR